MSGQRGFFVTGGRSALGLVATVVVIAAGSILLFSSTVSARYERDVSRMVFNDNLDVLDEVKQKIGASTDTLKQILVDSTESAVADTMPYIVVSIADHRLWYKRGDQTLFTTQVATGSGKVQVPSRRSRLRTMVRTALSTSTMKGNFCELAVISVCTKPGHTVVSAISVWCRASRVASR